MATTPLTIRLDALTRSRVNAAAAAANISDEDYLLGIVTTALPTSGVAETTATFDSPHDWTEANRRLAEYDRTGVAIPLEDALAAFDDAMEAALARIFHRREDRRGTGL